MESIPPTQDVVLQNCRWVAYQSVIWASSDMLKQFPDKLKGNKIL